jgi:hypothetical protein
MPVLVPLMVEGGPTREQSGNAVFVHIVEKSPKPMVAVGEAYGVRMRRCYGGEKQGTNCAVGWAGRQGECEASQGATDGRK